MAITPTQLQQQASDPASSVWVAASAGSGKTKVLVDRVLRLLLQHTSPDHILCITYTKAAAAEMLERITTKARTWVTLPPNTLDEALEALHGHPPTPAMQRKARTLFTMLTDATPGLRILTIHSFCQNVLNQFPMEAGIAPHFSVLDEQDAGQLIAAAKSTVLATAYHHPDGTLAQAIECLSERMSEFGFDDIINSILSSRRHFMAMTRDNEALEQAITALYEASHITPDTNKTDLARHWVGSDASYATKLSEYGHYLIGHGGKGGAKIGEAMITFASQPWSIESVNHLSGVILKADGTERAKSSFPVKAIKDNRQDITEELYALSRKCEEYMRACNLLDSTQTSHAIMVVAKHFFDAYQAQKNQRHVLDYDDLILKTLQLLQDHTLVDWVLYKLDGQIDHILIDEAQDTSLEQWQLSRHITEEFFAGDGAQSQSRSIFVVGDEKQSIYSFQGAAPKAFTIMRDVYEASSAQVNHPFRRVPMHTSFRSGEAILSLVDKVFEPEDARQAVTTDDTPIQHHAYRHNATGGATLYPLCINGEKDAMQPWQMAHERSHSLSSLKQCAAFMADIIAGWLDAGRVLPATGQAVRPQDILILMRRRNALVDALSQALKARNVPVAGLDRLELTEHIAIKDLLALARVLLDISDNFSLSALLTSPLYGLDYEQLTILCANREKGETVWQRLQVSQDDACVNAITELQALRALASSHTPHQLYCELLFARDGIQRFTARMGDGVRDIVHNLLYATKQHEATGDTHLQGFVAYMDTQTGSLKRDMEQSANEVRIMTIHGAKGLEAPIVMLPDTTSTPTVKESLMPHITPDGTTLMLHKTAKASLSGIFAKSYETLESEQYHEYLRLLYVALTRARDELHVFGYVGGKSKGAQEGSWYERIQEAMIGLSAETIEHDVCNEYDMDGAWLEYQCHQQACEGNMAQPPATAELPDYFLQPPAYIPTTQKRYTPSSLTEYQPHASHVPKEAKGLTGAARGTVLHACLEHQVNRSTEQFLNDLPSLLPRLHADGDSATYQSLIDDISGLLHHPDYGALLTQPAQAEVNICGTLADGRYISGAIDRLIVTDDSVTVIDFKTGLAPDAATDLPAPYIAQMRAYEALLCEIHPDKDMTLILLYIAPALRKFIL